MNSPEIKSFIRKHSSLFWHIPEDKKEDISHEVLVEYILNYGTMDDIMEMFSIMGIKEAARAFKNSTGRRKLNYYPEIHHYFRLFFEKYA